MLRHLFCKIRIKIGEPLDSIKTLDFNPHFTATCAVEELRWEN